MAMATKFRVGDRVVKDPAGWRPSAFDAWGAGVGVGVVLEIDEYLESLPDSLGGIDVRWPAGRCHQRAEELAAAPPL